MFCEHIYVAGPKKGTVCGTFCRKGGNICGAHKPRPKCEHGKMRTRCKECGGGSICEHNKQKSICKECKGSQVCEHNRIRSVCKECGGGSICEHKKQKAHCKECNGTAICEHNKERSVCKECGGGSICEHNKRRTYCKECNGGSICEHSVRTDRCKICDPAGHLASIVNRRINHAIHKDKTLHSIEYLGCDIEDFREHIQVQFKPGMTWENYGTEWHIDHIIPLKFPVTDPDGTTRPPTVEEVIERLDFENTQPMWAEENIAKGNRYIG